jgi:hypothetical protein
VQLDEAILSLLRKHLWNLYENATMQIASSSGCATNTKANEQCITSVKAEGWPQSAQDFASSTIDHGPTATSVTAKCPHVHHTEEETRRELTPQC